MLYVFSLQPKYVFFSQCTNEIPAPITPMGDKAGPKLKEQSKSRGGSQEMGKCKTILKTIKRGGVTKNVNFSIMGTNAAGLKAKEIAFWKMLNCLISQA